MCIDGFKPVVRDNMSTLTRLMNAKHAPVLNSEVTHLITETVRCDSYQASIYIARGLIADNMVIRQPQHWASRSCVLNG